MSKILKTIAILIILYVIPLLGNIGLLLNVKIFLLMVAGAIMFLTQPELKVSEAKGKKNTDRSSFFFILLAGTISQILAVIEWGYFSSNPANINNPVIASIGFVMLFGGLAFRYWAIRTLDVFFTATVQVLEGHKVIQSGPYKVVRHPSYLGALVAIVGGAVLLETPIATLFAVCSVFYAYKIRIGVEETALVSELGDDYREFQKIRKYKIIPLVW